MHMFTYVRGRGKPSPFLCFLHFFSFFSFPFSFIPSSLSVYPPTSLSAPQAQSGGLGLAIKKFSYYCFTYTSSLGLEAHCMALHIVDIFLFGWQSCCQIKKIYDLYGQAVCPKNKGRGVVEAIVSEFFLTPLCKSAQKHL